MVVDVLNINGDAREEPIERVTHSGIILPGADWHTLAHSGLTGKFSTFKCENVMSKT